jgi:hypothetical protein
VPTVTQRLPERSPRVTAKDVDRFSVVADIRDAQAFAHELQAFLRERLPPQGWMAAGAVQDVPQALTEKATALRAPVHWVPDASDIQRGRALVLSLFNQPQNLTPPQFAKLANKSRQQIYTDIRARRLLALRVGRRGQRLPDWQLDPLRQQLTQTILQETSGVDEWTLYRALSEPLEGLGGRSPVDAVTTTTTGAIVAAVLNVLGLSTG